MVVLIWHRLTVLQVCFYRFWGGPQANSLSCLLWQGDQLVVIVVTSCEVEYYRCPKQVRQHVDIKHNQVIYCKVFCWETIPHWHLLTLSFKSTRQCRIDISLPLTNKLFRSDKNDQKKSSSSCGYRLWYMGCVVMSELHLL